LMLICCRKLEVKMQHRIGIISVWAGLISCAVGLVAGFMAMPSGEEAKIGFWLSLVPLGFMLLLLGTVLTQLSGKEK
jgi:hypothetical protein